MIYTDEQFNELAQYEDRFNTAVYLRYARALPNGALERITEIHHAATGSKLRANGNCADCVKRVLRAVGVSYFTDKEARRIAAQMHPHKVETSEAPAEPVKKAVKTAQKSTKKAAPKKTTTKKKSAAKTA